jgi:predicted RNA binding protein YcfA (HicA-like mRNA interferase family)
VSQKIPALKPKEVMRALKRAGFYIHHTSGSHYYLKHPKDPAILVSVPFKVRDIKRGTLHSILRQAKLSREEFLRLLEGP